MSPIAVKRRALPRPAALAAAGLLLVASAVAVTPRPAPGAAAPPSQRAPAALAAVPANQAPTAAAALAPRADGSHAVFYRGQDDAVYQRSLANGAWGPQSSLGGLIVGAPAGASTGTSTHVLAARGRDSRLYLRTYSGTWSGWQSLGGVLSAAPAVVAASDGRQDVFVRATDNSLYTRTKPAGGSWSAWTGLGGSLASAPAAVALAPGRIDVFAVGTDYALWRRSLAGGMWSGWTRIGGRTYTAPAAARAPDGRAWVFVRATNDALYLYDGTAGWRSLGGLLIDAPAASTTSQGGVDVVVRGRDNALWSTMLRTGPTWSTFQRAWTPAAPMLPAPSLMGIDWERIPTATKVVALTFDAGGDAEGLASIRNTLQAKNVPATFFLTGNWARQFPERANEVAIAGFRVGNHSNTHPDLTNLSDAGVLAEIRNAQQAILISTGADSRPLFRFPFGAVDGRVLGLVNGLDYVAVRWTVDSLGWQGTSGGQTVQKVADRVFAARRPGEIVLMHVGSHPTDGSTLDAAALPQIVDRLRADGYTFVTLNALLGY
ncbi:MAG TPA: polysaccharide deacetylase family protein [Micromonosporaceae bacterium]|nr:polysaccharide deacetylase family protein [Micromonosporaceae bacterium]